MGAAPAAADDGDGGASAGDGSGGGAGASGAEPAAVKMSRYQRWMGKTSRPAP